MRFASLGSGSKGNATLINKHKTYLLLDNGFSVKETEYRLQRLGLEAEALTAILVTHEHDVAKHANRIIRLKDGRIESDVEAGNGIAKELVN